MADPKVKGNTVTLKYECIEDDFYDSYTKIKEINGCIKNNNWQILSDVEALSSVTCYSDISKTKEFWKSSFCENWTCSRDVVKLITTCVGTVGGKKGKKVIAQMTPTVLDEKGCNQYQIYDAPLKLKNFECVQNKDLSVAACTGELVEPKAEDKIKSSK